MDKGKIIVLEGIDASGKETQTKMLTEALNRGVLGECETLSYSFPNYLSESSGPVKMFLGGELGTREMVGWKNISYTYAVDRMITQHKEKIQEQINNGKWVVFDRYTSSNVIYQSYGVKSKADIYKVWKWMRKLEQVNMGISEPDIIIFLETSPKASQMLLNKRIERYSGYKDINESDISLQEWAHYSAGVLCDAGYMKRVMCLNEEGKMRSREDIHKDIMKMVDQELV